MSKRGKLFLISGPSGVGKQTLIRKLEDFPELNIVLSISCTTRNKREGEVDGTNYFFISKEEFQKKIEKEEFLEYAFFFNNYYGTCKKFVESKLNKGKNVLLEIETEGFRQIVEQKPDVISIFIKPPSIEALRERLLKRGSESEEHINIRIDKAIKEMEESDLFRYSVINDDLEKGFEDLKAILEKEINEKD